MTSASERPSPPVPNIIDQLRAMAGAAAGSKDFVLHGAGGDIRVTYGSLLAHSVTLTAPFPSARGGGAGAYRGSGAAPLRAERPLRIQLSKESSSDKRAKDGGVNLEVQTGDPAFDSEVYIDAPCPDEHVRAVLASEDARAAVLALLREVPTYLHLDDWQQHITVCYTIAHGEEKDPERGARIVQAFDRLLGAVPRLETTGVSGQGVSAWAALGLIIGPPALGAAALFITTPQRCKPGEHDLLLNCAAGPECCRPPAAGAAAGIVAAGLIALFIIRKLKGKSDSSFRRRFWITYSLILLVELGVLIARLLG